jgi:hypothetical protein
VGAAKSRQALRQLARHVGRAAGRSGGDLREARGDGEQVLDPVAHFAGEQLVTFLGLLAARDVQEDPEHDPGDHADVVAPPARGDPAHLVAEQDAEVGLVTSDNRPRGRERRANPVAIRGMDMGGELLERDALL